MDSLEFSKQYAMLLIKQYYYKPKAQAEIKLYADTLHSVYNFLDSFETEFDIDNAIGDRLDKIGKIVGIPRIVPFVLPKVRFGFSNNSNALGFASKENINRLSSTFFRQHEHIYTSQQLDDNDYRFFIKAKIAINNASAYMVSDDRYSINEVIESVFSGDAYVVDNQNMSLTLYINPSIPTLNLAITKRLKLLPKPQGVKYSAFIKADPKTTFGFSKNHNSKSFSQGTFARKVLI